MSASSPCCRLAFCDSISASLAPAAGHGKICFLLASGKLPFNGNGLRSVTVSNGLRRAARLPLCFAARGDGRQQTGTEAAGEDSVSSSARTNSGRTGGVTSGKLSERAARRKVERHAYLFAAVASSFGITSMAAAAVYYRFAWQMQGAEVPLTEMFGTFSLALGATVGMEFWARWAHRALWHASLWHMHQSHHQPRDGPFELNDVFAIINAVPAIALTAYGFFNKGLVPGLCFGAGLGITVFGMAYMFVHDGLVHRRFPVGPIANVPYLRKVATAHQLHHADKFNGVPYGLFLGPKELEEVGGLEELEKLLQNKIKASKSLAKGERS